MWKVTLVLVASAASNLAEPKSIRTGRPSSLIEDVGRLDVAVEHADPVRAVEPFGDRPDDVPQGCLVEAAALP